MAQKKKEKKVFVDDLGRSWDSDMGDAEAGDEVRICTGIVKIIELEPGAGSGTALYEWTSTSGEVKRHLGLPPMKRGEAYRSETKARKQKEKKG